MEWEEHRRRVIALVLLAALSIGVEGIVDGPGVAVGLALLGALLGAWVVVYQKVMLSREPPAPTLLLVGAAAGGVILPALATLHLVVGSLVWAGVVITLLAWGVAESLWTDRVRRQDLHDDW